MGSEIEETCQALGHAFRFSDDFMHLRFDDKWFGRLFWKAGDEGTIDRFGPDGAAWLVARGTRYAQKVQSGYLYSYALVMLLGADNLSLEAFPPERYPQLLVGLDGPDDLGVVDRGFVLAEVGRLVPHLPVPLLDFGTAVALDHVAGPRLDEVAPALRRSATP